MRIVALLWLVALFAPVHADLNSDFAACRRHILQMDSNSHLLISNIAFGCLTTVGPTIKGIGRKGAHWH